MLLYRAKDFLFAFVARNERRCTWAHLERVNRLSARSFEFALDADSFRATT